MRQKRISDRIILRLESFLKRLNTTSKMSAIDNEIGPTVEIDLNDDSLANVVKGKRKQPKRILHFSDGTIEEYDSDDSEEDAVVQDGVEQPFQKVKQQPVEAEPPIDPKTLTWPAWVKHYTVTGGSKTLDVMDRMGEGIAYFLGITSPKYQYEIDEYYRMKEEEKATKKSEEMERQSWVPPASNEASTGEVITEELTMKQMGPNADNAV